MVFLDPFEVGEQQVHRHGASHLPNGKDPVFIPVADPKEGEVLVFQNGTWTTQNITTLITNLVTSILGPVMLAVEGGDSDPILIPGPPGPPGPVGPAGTGGMMPQDPEDNEPMMFRPGP